MFYSEVYNLNENKIKILKVAEINFFQKFTAVEAVSVLQHLI